jgi:hypothetical protein
MTGLIRLKIGYSGMNTSMNLGSRKCLGQLNVYLSSKGIVIHRVRIWKSLRGNRFLAKWKSHCTTPELLEAMPKHHNATPICEEQFFPPVLCTY